MTSGLSWKQIIQVLLFRLMLDWCALSELFCGWFVFFFNAVLSVWKWCWPFSSLAWRMMVWRKRWHIQVPPSTLASLSWERSKVTKLLTAEFTVGKHKTTAPCRFLLLFLPYGRLYHWNQMEFINEQMYLFHFPTTSCYTVDTICLYIWDKPFFQ